MVRTALTDGYREVGATAVVEQFHHHRPVYMLLALLRAMNHLDARPDLVMPGATSSQIDSAAHSYRELVMERLE